MRTVHTLKELRAIIRSYRTQGKRVGLVPTMGNLHEGHLALVRRAHEAADVVVTSIFVNPMQFGAGEDLDAYPVPWLMTSASWRQKAIPCCLRRRSVKSIPTALPARPASSSPK